MKSPLSPTSDVTFVAVLSGILECASDFSTRPTNNPRMEARDRLLGILESMVAAVLPDSGFGPGLLQVRAGGRMGHYSPVCWLRIYDPRHSPSAQNGFYVVLLFAADGTAAYLSLNQGTSEFRSGQMRPIRDSNEIANRSAEAAIALSSWNPQIFESGCTKLELGADRVSVKSDSKRRIRNYEAGNIIAKKYTAADLPNEEMFAADLSELLALLLILQRDDLGSLIELSNFVPPSTLTAQSKDAFSGQGRQIDPKTRRLIELAAEDRTVAHYEEHGWKVERVGSQKLGFDLRCTQDGKELHVEVKGTVGAGGAVILTRNEVNHARNYPFSVLAVVTGIVVDENYNVNHGGQLTLFEPWKINDEQLEATRYTYRI